MFDRTDEKLMKKLRDALVNDLLTKIESGEATGQDRTTAARLLQNYNIDLDTDKEEDEMTEEERALLDEWGIDDPLSEEELPSNGFEVPDAD